MENTVIKLNDHYTFDINSFSRNTSVQDGKLVSAAYITLKDPDNEDLNTLRGIAMYPITEIQILFNETDIYHQQNMEGRITSIDESLTEEGKMRTTFYIYS